MTKSISQLVSYDVSYDGGNQWGFPDHRDVYEMMIGYPFPAEVISQTTTGDVIAFETEFTASDIIEIAPSVK